MGALVAAVDKKGENAVPTVLVMLESLAHRGTNAHGVATQTSVETAKSLKELKETNLSSNMAVGYNLSRVTGRDEPQPVLGNDYAIVFEGRLFPPSEVSDLREVVNRLEDDPKRNASRILRELDGSYAFAICCSDEAIAGRDALGIIPLYYGESERLCGLASERKALWALGIKAVKSFPPGNVAIIRTQGFTFKKVKTITQPKIKRINIDVAAKHLRKLLLESVAKRVRDIDEVAVAFSGGLDSTVIAVLAKMCKVDVHLVSVGLEGQLELQHAKHASEALGLPIHVQTYNMNDIEKTVSKVLWLIEEPGPMKVAVAIPFFWTAEVASKIGCNVLLAGQGGDELFGGYYRYLAELQQKGTEALQKTLYWDVVFSHETNFQRDFPVCAFHKVELRLPFIDHEVVNFALSLPLELKIESQKDLLRKRVLRRVAESLGIPVFIANRTKKAVQYATGVSRALRKLAKSKGLTVGGYLKQLFHRLYPDLEASP